MEKPNKAKESYFFMNEFKNNNMRNDKNKYAIKKSIKLYTLYIFIY